MSRRSMNVATLPWTPARQRAAEKGEAARRQSLASEFTYVVVQIAPGPGARHATAYMLSPEAAAEIRALPDEVGK